MWGKGPTNPTGSSSAECLHREDSGAVRWSTRDRWSLVDQGAVGPGRRGQRIPLALRGPGRSSAGSASAFTWSSTPGTNGLSRHTCARSRSRRPGPEHPARGSRNDAHVRDVRSPDQPPLRPSSPTDSVSMCTCALYGHSRAPRGAVSIAGRDDGLRPPRPRPPFTARHSPGPRAAANRTARTARGTPLAPFPGCDLPGRWHNQRAIGNPQEVSVRGRKRQTSPIKPGCQGCDWSDRELGA